MSAESNGPIADVTFSETHKQLLSGSKKVLLEGYAKIAPTFDQFTVENNSRVNKHIVANSLFEHIGTSNRKISLLDAGCGTGLPAEIIAKMATERSLDLDMVGIDFSPDMLEQARKKKVYSRLMQGDLSNPLDLPPHSFHVFIACGLFADGHCGPEALVNISRCIKPGGIGVITVRHKTYTALEEEYLRSFAESKLEVVENFVDEFFSTIVLANYIVLKKL